MEDGGVDVGLFEVAVMDVEDDGAVEEEEDVKFELGAEGDGEPDGVGGVGGLGGVGGPVFRGRSLSDRVSIFKEV